jgi:hypothetical protein
MGSIYDPVFKQYNLDLPRFEPRLAPAEDHIICTSQDVRSIKLSIGADM